MNFLFELNEMQDADDYVAFFADQTRKWDIEAHEFGVPIRLVDVEWWEETLDTYLVDDDWICIPAWLCLEIAGIRS